MKEQTESYSWALITGATSGIGKAYAAQLASMGYNLLLTGRREALLASFAQELKAQGVQVKLVIGDLTQSEVVTKLLSEAADLELDWIVNNAGYGTDSPFFSEQTDELSRMINLHTQVPVRICHALIPKMIDNNRGFVVNVSSLASHFPLPGTLLYTSTKAMLHHFSLSLSLELDSTGIRVQSFLPGFTHTDFHDRLSHFNHERKSKGIVHWQRADEAVSSSIKAITGKKWKRITHIPGWRNHLLKLTGSLPFWLYRVIALKVN